MKTKPCKAAGRTVWGEVVLALIAIVWGIGSVVDFLRSGLTVFALLGTAVFSFWLVNLLFYVAICYSARNAWQALAWHRWRRLELWLTVERILSRFNNRFKIASKNSIVLQRASLVAARGDLEAAERFVCSAPDLTEEMQAALLASVYAHARRFDLALKEVSKATALAPENAVLRLELAYFTLRCRSDAPAAGATLKPIRDSELDDLTRSRKRHCEGLLALLAGEYSQAQELFEEALLLLPQGIYAEASKKELSADLALVQANRGQVKEAKRSLDRCKDYLLSIGEREWLDKILRAIGQAEEANQTKTPTDTPTEPE